MLQGAGAALLMPGTLSIITVTFPPHERAKAIGLWAGTSAFALALGPTVGGLMVEHLGWQSVFFLNLPIGVVAFFVATRTVTESRSEITRELDLPGLFLGSGALLGATYGLIEANERGWSDPVIVVSLVASAVLGISFLLWERRSPKAMLPLSFFRIPAFTAGNTVAFSVSLGMFATFFFLSLYMQLIRGYTPFEAGLRFLPMTAVIIVTAPNAGRYASRHGSRIPMTYGLILAGTGLLIFSRLSVDTPYLLMLPVFVIMGHGIGSTMAPMTAAVMNAVGPQRAGPRLGHHEHVPGGGGAVRDRAARDDPHDPSEGHARALARRDRPLPRTAGADRERGRPGAARPVRARRVVHRNSRAPSPRVPRVVHERLPRLAARRRDRAAGRGGGRQPVHPRAGARAGGPPGGPGRPGGGAGGLAPADDQEAGSRSAGMAGSVNPKILCEPSQNGLFLDWPQRQSVCRLRTS